MSRTYKVTGINLKTLPMGESDRLLTVLTPDYGLMKMMAPGARKHKSSLGGRSGLFVVNQLVVVKGRSLDRIIQAQTIASYPKLSQNLGRLTAGQYLAELVLFQALSDQPQPDLFAVLLEHLTRLEKSTAIAGEAALAELLARLCQAIFHLLALAGVAPQVHRCCLTQQPLTPPADPSHWAHWYSGFSIVAGGTIAVSSAPGNTLGPSHSAPTSVAKDSSSQAPDVTMRLTAPQLTLLQQLSQPDLPWLDLDDDRQQKDMQQLSRVPITHGQFSLDNQSALQEALDSPSVCHNWLVLERLLRHYAQYHFERPIRSADLMTTYLSSALSSATHCC